MNRRRKTDLGSAIAVAVIAFLVFGRTLGAEFLNWDDPVNVTKNPLIQSLAPDNLKAIFTDFVTAARYKPLAWFGWAVIHAVYELDPAGYHFANVALHAINSALFFLILLGLGRRAITDETRVDQIRIAAGIGALFWALHPLRVEPVAWVTGFPYGLSLLFMLSSLLLYLRCDFQRSAMRQRAYWLALFAYLLACLAYPTVLGFTAALVAIDFVPLKRFQRGDKWSFTDAAAHRAWLEKVPFALIAGALIVGTIFGVKHLSGGWFDEWQLGKATLLSKVMQSLYMEAVYLWKTAAPIGLCPVYFDLFEISGREPHLIGGALLTLVITWIAFGNWRRQPTIAALWFAHLGLMAPFLGVTAYPHYPSDRYSIIAGTVFAGALFAYLASRKVARFQTTASVAGGLVLLCAWLSFDRSRVWLNDDVFFPDMVAKLPDGPHRSRAFFLHGRSMQNRGEHETADQLFRQSWKVCVGEPPDELAFHHGVSLIHLRNFEAALEQFRLAQRIQDDTPAIRGNIGFALMQLGRFAEAESIFASIVAEQPENHRDRINLAITQLQQGKTDNALEQLETVRRQMPDFPPVYLQLAQAHRAAGSEAAAARAEAEFRRLTGGSP